MDARLKRGFTLVELLVVIAIIGILIALLLPAVQAAREAARRSSCSNNLKQISLAIHNYADANKVFPPGSITYGGCCGNPFQVGWTISILPYAEQKPLYGLYNPTKFIEDPENQALRESPCPVYYCPSDDMAGKLEIPQNSGLNSSRGQLYRHGSYKAMAGYGTSGNFWSSAEVGGLNYNRRGAIHVVGYDPKYTCESFGTIRDGTSNTLMIGEYYSRTHSRRGVFWALPYGGASMATAFNDVRVLVPDYDYCINAPTDNPPGLGAGNMCKHTFAPAHPGGIQFSLVDGSVRMLPSTIDMLLYCQLSTIARSEPVQLP